MILESMRAVTDWLNRDDYGVNHFLASIPVDEGDQPPSRVAVIYDETRDDLAARAEEPLVFPAIYVTMDLPFEMDGPIPTGQFREAASMTMAIRYLRKDWSTANAVRDTLYTLRAVVKSITELAKPAHADSRTRNYVGITAVNRVSQMLTAETVGESVMTGAVVLDLAVRDLAP